MGTVNVTIMHAGGSSARGSLPIFTGPVLSAENVTSSATSAVSTGSVSGPRDVFRIATDTAIYIKFGSAPTAAAGDEIMVPANSVYEHGGLNAGTVVAVINV